MKTKEIVSANIMTVGVETNCPCGGDAGHGGVTVFELQDDGGTCWEVEVIDGHGQSIQIKDLKRIRISLYGDCECGTLIEAAEFAADTLNDMRRSNVWDAHRAEMMSMREEITRLTAENKTLAELITKALVEAERSKSSFPTSPDKKGGT